MTPRHSERSLSSFRRIVLLGLTLSLLATGFARAQEAVPWTVEPEPWSFKMDVAKPTKMSLPIPGGQSIHHTEAPSPFFALAAPDSKNGPTLQLYDLRTLSPVGKPVQSPKIDLRNLRISPHGDQILSIDGKADRPTVVVYSTTGQPPVPIVINDTKTKIEGIEFVGKGRVLTVKEIREDNKPRRYWQVWDAATGKEVTRIQTQLEYSPKWTAISPGGRHVVIQDTGGAGYFLHFWDLTTGKKAGLIPLQEKTALWGQCASLTFSPDGKELALTWRLEKDGVVVKIMRYDLVKGVKIGEHKLMTADAKPSSPGLLAGRTRTLQYLPDGRTWLLSGHQIVDRETGTIVGKVDPAPRFNGDTRDRRFLGSYHLIDLQNRALTVLELPRADLDDAITKARANPK